MHPPPPPPPPPHLLDYAICGALSLDPSIRARETNTFMDAYTGSDKRPARKGSLVTGVPWVGYLRLYIAVVWLRHAWQQP